MRAILRAFESYPLVRSDSHVALARSGAYIRSDPHVGPAFVLIPTSGSLFRPEMFWFFSVSERRGKKIHTTKSKVIPRITIFFSDNIPPALYFYTPVSKWTTLWKEINLFRYNCGFVSSTFLFRQQVNRPNLSLQILSIEKVDNEKNRCFLSDNLKKCRLRSPPLPARGEKPNFLLRKHFFLARFRAVFC